MAVLLLRVAGPLQSWGDSSRFTRRTTRREPTKSGIVGLIASAMGRGRQDSVDDLARLEMGVRADQAGELVRDFQTERTVDGKKSLPLSHRYYLADACFLVALSGDEVLLATADTALRCPRWPLYLGRRSCPPTLPLTLGIREEYSDVREAMEREPWLASERYRSLHGSVAELDIACDARDGELCESQADYPLSFSGEGRRYACRPVFRYKVQNPDIAPASDAEAAAATEAGHDPMGWF